MKTKIVGILNYTPDSFSDGGNCFTLDAAISRAEQLFADGADIVDIGANATSYGSILLTAEEEWARVGPLLQVLGPLYGHKLSVDTFYSSVARNAIDLGVCMINDVSGAKDQSMIDVIASAIHVQYVVMYSLVVPANKAIRAKNFAEVYDFGAAMKHKLITSGIEQSRIIFDPGIGFATDAALSIEIISHLSKLHELQMPIYIGHSRKSFFESMTTQAPQDRDIETLAASIYMALNGVGYLRVHNVSMHARALNVIMHCNASKESC